MLNLEQGIAELKKELKANRLIAFIGSGISKPAPSNLPDWDHYIIDFIQHCKHVIDLLPNSTKHLYDELISDAENRIATDPVKVASVLREFLNDLNSDNSINLNIDDSFKTWFIEKFSNREYNENHKLITEINFPYILTSNYDMLLEKALADSRFKTLSLKTYTFTEADSIAASLFSREFAVIHIHGKFQNVSLNNIVFTSEDYTKMLKRSYPGFTMSIQNLFSNFSTLFIGYGGSDPHLEDLLEEHSFYLNYSNNRSLSKNYLVVLKSKADSIYSRHKIKRRTEIIAIDNYEDYKILLESLKKDFPRELKLFNTND